MADLHQERHLLSAVVTTLTYRELRIEPVNVPADDDCLFWSFIQMCPERLRQVLQLGSGEDLTPARLRGWLAGRVAADFAGPQSRYAAFFDGATGTANQDDVRAAVVTAIRTPGSWNNEHGYAISQILAVEAGSPTTLVGRGTHHLGPVEQAPQHYIVDDGWHYRGATTTNITGRVLPAQEAAPVVARIRERADLDLSRARDDAAVLAQHRDIYHAEYTRLFGEVLAWLATAPGAGSGDGNDVASRVLGYAEVAAQRPVRWNGDQAGDPGEEPGRRSARSARAGALDAASSAARRTAVRGRAAAGRRAVAARAQTAPQEAPSRVAMIVGLLQAERAAWLALNRASRLERYRDG